jgi:hypothetical protein
MAAVPDDRETQPQLRAVSVEAAPAEHPAQPGDPDLTCSEDGSRCLSREERRAIGRRVIAERQRAFELLEMYDSR